LIEPRLREAYWQAASSVPVGLIDSLDMRHCAARRAPVVHTADSNRGLTARRPRMSRNQRHVSGSARPQPYGRAVTITCEETPREHIRAHLAGHDRRTVTDLTKRHAAVAVVVVDSEVGEDRVDPAPLDDWIAGRPVGAGLDGRMVDVSGVPLSFCAAGHLASLHMPRSGRSLAGGVDPGETAVEAALRELDEEVGIRLSDSTMLGIHPTRSG
jgi:NUDIX domain